MTVGRTSDFRPETVRNPVLHHPRSTVSPRPKEGSHPSSTAKIQISSTPIRKVGSDTPMSEPDSTSCASQPRRLIAV